MPQDSHHDEPLAFKATMDTTTYNTKDLLAPAFEDVLDAIGSRGKFQKRMNITYLFIGSSITVMSVLVYHLAMQTPDHWCHVPGREKTNFSVAEWRNVTIPSVNGTFSKCMMYNLTEVVDVANLSTVHCQYGWDYDDTWFTQTLPSQMNWVCDEAYIVHDAMFYIESIGVLLLLFNGYVGDTYGRRLQQMACIAALAAGRIVMVFTPSVYVLFIMAGALASGAYGPIIESAASVGMELTDIRYRLKLNWRMSVSTAMAMVGTGLVAWALRRWTYFTLFSALCSLALFVFHRWFPESPRWLACRGREEEALDLLKRIAATNGSSVPPFTSKVLHNMAKFKGDTKGFLSIFSSFNLFKNVLILVIGRAVFLLSTYALVLSAGVLSVNPFLSLSAQGAAQLPALFVVYPCAHRFGRRWSAVASVTLTAFSAVVMILLLTGGAPAAAVTAVAVWMQFCTSASGGIISLQSVEVHPTCLRQITASVEYAATGLLLSLLPYIVFLGGSVDHRLPFAILSALNLLTGFLLSFLPETALQRLPDSLQDAAVFGKDHAYWSWKPKPPPVYELKE